MYEKIIQRVVPVMLVIVFVAAYEHPTNRVHTWAKYALQSVESGLRSLGSNFL